MAFGSLENQKPDLEPYVLKTGDTMTGQLILPGVPANDLGAVPKSFVETIGMGGRQNKVQPNVGLKPIKNLKIAFDRTAICKCQSYPSLHMTIINAEKIPNYSSNMGMLIEIEVYGLPTDNADTVATFLPSKYYIPSLENKTYYMISPISYNTATIYDGIQYSMQITNKSMSFNTNFINTDYTDQIYKNGPFFIHLKIATFTT